MSVDVCATPLNEKSDSTSDVMITKSADGSMSAYPMASSALSRRIIFDVRSCSMSCTSFKVGSAATASVFVIDACSPVNRKSCFLFCRNVFRRTFLPFATSVARRLLASPVSNVLPVSRLINFLVSILTH